MYRAVGLKALQRGIDVEDLEAVERLVAELDLELVLVASGDFAVWLDGRDPGESLRAPEVSDLTSRLAALPVVRKALVERQRRAAADRGAVLEGRDIGTVVFPETPFKFFLDAAAAVRAERRWHQLEAADSDALGRPELEALERARDERDAGREDSPLRADSTYVWLDTSDLSLEEVADRMLAVITEGRPSR